MIAAPGRIRLLATDLDGTLLRTDGTVSERTRAVLAQAREAGFPVVFVTGRPPRWMASVAATTGHAAVAVCGNGAVLLDVERRHVVHRHEIHEDIGVEVVRRLRDLTGEPPLFAVEQAAPGALPPDGPGRTAADPLAGERLARSGDIIKILAKVEAPANHADEILAAAQAELAGLVEVTHSSSQVLLECSPLGVTKATTLAEYARELGVGRAEVATVGDMPNDISMLRWAGASFAVATGHPAVIRVADGVVAGPEDDGVAHLIASLLESRG